MEGLAWGDSVEYSVISQDAVTKLISGTSLLEFYAPWWPLPKSGGSIREGSHRAVYTGIKVAKIDATVTQITGKNDMVTLACVP